MQAVFTRDFSPLWSEMQAELYYLVRWYDPVLINTAANRVTHSDRRLPNNLVTIALWLSIRTSTWQTISTIISSIYNITDPTGSSSSSSGPYLFQSASVQNHIYHITTHHKYFHYHLCLICLPLQAVRHTHIDCFAAKTLSCSQNLQERLQYGLHPLLFLIMACFCYLNSLC